MPVKNPVQIFKALSDPSRLRIVRLLLRREICVCEIMFILGMEQTRVSHHMRVLREADLAEDVRDGRWIIYRIPAATRGLVENLLQGALGTEIERSTEMAGDLRKLEACVRENIRGRVCAASPPRAVRTARQAAAQTAGRVKAR
ncbi:MAG: metalloregulator ArsR/SmtB family transcription factor [Candidatus Aminicenantes bacterium]|nr:metalloregulator ArsR/SmtB family transcription factor [Candidatus Aminicenantes bacterium]